MNKYFNAENIKGVYQQAMAYDVGEALKLCYYQEPEFRQAVEQSDKTFQDCMNHVASKVIRRKISDLDAFNKAVDFYFPGAKVHFNMTIDLCGNTDTIEMTSSRPMSICLDNLMDF